MTKLVTPLSHGKAFYELSGVWNRPFTEHGLQQLLQETILLGGQFVT